MALSHGIVPMAPRLVALKRYLYEGKQKGQLGSCWNHCRTGGVFCRRLILGGEISFKFGGLLEPALFLQ